VATDFIMPKLGLTMTEGKVIKWLRTVGTAVRKGEPLAEIMTDKVTCEIESPVDGVLARTLVPPQKVVPVGAVIALIAQAGEQISVSAPRTAASPVPAPPTPASPVPAAPARAVPAARVSGDAAAQSARASPAVRKMARDLGVDIDMVKGTGPEGRVMEADLVRARDAALQVPMRAEPVRTSPSAPALFGPTPLARSIASKESVDLGPVTGTGPAGRVVARDVLATVHAAGGRRVPLSELRSIIAERTARSCRETARVTLVREVRMDRIKRIKDELGPAVQERTGCRLSYADFFIWALARATPGHPEANALFAGDSIEVMPQVNVGFAVDLPDGLMVPVIKDADRKSLSGIAQERTRLTEACRSGRVVLDDLSEGTVTVSNLGTLGVDFFAPVINLPQAMILGVGRVAERPAVVAGELRVCLTVFLSLVFDHRVIDGAPAAGLLGDIAAILENPDILFL